MSDLAPQRILLWPMRNDAGADLLAPGDVALLRFHWQQRDLLAARMSAELLQALDESLTTPLSAAGIVVVARDRQAGFDLPSALAAVEADALLFATITDWVREPVGRDNAAVRASFEVTLLAPGAARPLFSWRITDAPLGQRGASRIERDARALLTSAGSRLAELLAPPP